MIRINLLAVERDRAKRRVVIDAEQRVTLACGAILVAALGVAVWQVLSVRAESARLDDQHRSVDQELTTLADVLERRNEFESRSAELARRVTLIEELRAGQGGPVRMLDQVSRALPDGVWFTELRQQGDSVTIQGRATGLTGLSDLVVGMESSGYFALPVEIVDSQLESRGEGEVVRFELRGRFVLPSSRAAGH